MAQELIRMLSVVAPRSVRTGHVVIGDLEREAVFRLFTSILLHTTLEGRQLIRWRPQGLTVISRVVVVVKDPPEQPRPGISWDYCFDASTTSSLFFRS